MDRKTKKLSRVVSQAEWQAARDKLLLKEKAETRALDALAAERRRLPMVKIEKNYVFEGSEGKARLVDLFDGRRQLILYHFMFAPASTAGPTRAVRAVRSSSTKSPISLMSTPATHRWFSCPAPLL